MSESEYSENLVAQCTYSYGKTIPTDLQTAIDNLLSRETAVLAGGLIAMKGKFYLFPGCCAGIEGWRDWELIRQGSSSPWLGHDPDPWIDTSDPKAILHKDRKAEIKCIEVEYEEIQTALKKAEKELNAFLLGLEEWLVTKNIEDAKSVSKKIDCWYKITNKGAQ